jgi:hypothetical protein
MKLYNKYHNTAPDGAVYIGRPSIWGNPYVVGKHGSRDQVVEMYSIWLSKQLQAPEFLAEFESLASSPGLVCFCAPKRCHGHALIEEMKRRRLVPVEVGDKVQWLCNGVYQFAEPHTVANIFTDANFGTYVFVEGGTTGIQIGELFLWEG